MTETSSTDTSGTPGPFFWHAAEFSYDESRRELRVGGNAVDLEPRPLHLLGVLLRAANQTVSKLELLDRVWGVGVEVGEGVLTNAINKLRTALGDAERSLIQTVPKLGYRLNVSVEKRRQESLPPESILKKGRQVPRRPNWVLETLLGSADRHQVWLARHAKTDEARVLKFSLSDAELDGLKKEVTVARLIRASLGERSDTVRLMDWDFEQAPYFVEFEYGGLDLTKWARDGLGLADRPMTERLECVVRVSETIADAHDLGILHKDIKPANVLIEDGSDGQLQIKVADFGVAGLLELDRLTELGITALGFTRPESQAPGAGTPFYLAPEVASGGQATTRSDQYALGVLLYQLVVGDLRRPLTAGWQEDVSDPLLREDIEQAANTDPEKRFASVRQLAYRLRNLDARRLDRERELAARAKALETKKQLERAQARRPFIVASFLILAAGIATSFWLYRSALGSAAEAKRQFEIAQAVNGFLNQDILTAADPLQGGSPAISLKQALDQAQGRLPARFVNQPEVEARIQSILGDAYLTLTDFQASDAAFERSAELVRSTQGTNSVAYAKAIVDRARGLGRAGKQEEAESLLDEVEPRLQGLRDANPKLAAEAAYARASARFYKMQFQAALDHLSDALSWAERDPTVDDAFLLTLEQAYASALSRAGRAEEALPVAERARDKIFERQGKDSVPALAARHTVARIRITLGQERELADEYLVLIADYERLLGSENEHTRLAMQGLAHVLTKAERWEEAASYSGKLWEASKLQPAANPLNRVVSLTTYSVSLTQSGQAKKAVELLREGYELLPAEGIQAEVARGALDINMAHALVDLNDFEAAIPFITRLTGDGGRTLRQLDSDAAGEIAYLHGRLLQKQGRLDEAASAFTQADADLAKKNNADYWLRKRVATAKSRLES